MQVWNARRPNFSALNRGRHLYSAGRPSRWASAHILVMNYLLGCLLSVNRQYHPPIHSSQECLFNHLYFVFNDFAFVVIHMQIVCGFFVYFYIVLFSTAHFCMCVAYFLRNLIASSFCLQCFDAVGWASGRAYGLCLEGGGVDLHMMQLMPLPSLSYLASLKSRMV